MRAPPAPDCAPTAIARRAPAYYCWSRLLLPTHARCTRCPPRAPTPAPSLTATLPRIDPTSPCSRSLPRPGSSARPRCRLHAARLRPCLPVPAIRNRRLRPSAAVPGAQLLPARSTSLPVSPRSPAPRARPALAPPSTGAALRRCRRTAHHRCRCGRRPPAPSRPSGRAPRRPGGFARTRLCSAKTSAR
nr:predicted GPI-anchored protein 58 [Aegilops tauschii subsp. strangulata]